MAQFSVLILTASPSGLGKDSGGSAFIKIDGREALLKSAELFLNRDNVKQIQCVVPTEQMDEAKKKYGPHFGFSGIKLITGGPKWVDQIAAAKDKIAGEATHVVVHDAARPAVAFSDIDAVLAATEKAKVAALAVPLRTGLIETDEGGAAVGLRSPEHLWQLLTPIVYDKATFAEYASTKSEPHVSLMTLVKGLPHNIRLDSAADVGRVSAMLKLLPKPKVKSPDNPFDEAQW